MKTPKFNKSDKVTWSEGSYPNYTIERAIDSGNGFFTYEMKSPEGTICGPAREDELTETFAGEYICISTKSDTLLWFADVETETAKAFLLAVVAYTCYPGTNDTYGRVLGKVWIPRKWLKQIIKSDDYYKNMGVERPAGRSLEFKLNGWASDKLRFFAVKEVEEKHSKQIAAAYKARNQK